jgi:LCP family protein required for cell wall assembly
MLEHLDDPLPFVPDGSFRSGVDRRIARRRRTRRFGRATVSAVTVAALSVIGFVAYEWRNAGNIPHVAIESLTPADGEVVNILVLGVDTRAFVGTSPEPSSTDVGRRSDTMIVVRVDRAANSISALSLPRDLWVRQPDGSSTRLNAAYYRGADALVETITTNYGIEINRFVELHFEGFAELVDLLGGVRISFPAPARDTYTGLAIAGAGCASLRGTDALALVRARHYEYRDGETWQGDATADLGRVARQRTVVLALLREVRSVARSPLAFDRLVDTMTQYVTRDDGLLTGDLVALARFVATVPLDRVHGETLPVAETTQDGNHVVVPAQGANEVLTRFGAPPTTASEPAPASTYATPAPLATIAPCD